MNSNQSRGRIIVLMIVVQMIGLSLIVIGHYVVMRGTDRLPTQLGRFVLTCLLGFYLYGGSSIAKWLTVILTTLAAVLALFTAPKLPLFQLGPLVLMAGIYLNIAWLLVSSSAANQFLEYQRGG